MSSHQKFKMLVERHEDNSGKNYSSFSFYLTGQDGVINFMRDNFINNFPFNKDISKKFEISFAISILDNKGCIYESLFYCYLFTDSLQELHINKTPMGMVLYNEDYDIMSVDEELYNVLHEAQQSVRYHNDLIK